MRRTVCFGAETATQAGAYFRAALPAEALRRLRWNTDVALFTLTPQTPKEIRKDPRIRGWNGPGTRIQSPASIVTLRIMDDVVVNPEDPTSVAVDYKMESMAADIERARDAGQIVLYDIDDDIWHIPEWSPAAKAMHKMAPTVRATDLEVVNANIKACNGVIVSTPALKEIVEALGFGVPVYVVRPGIDPSIYPKRENPNPSLRVGWMGSISHHLPHLRTMQIALAVLPKYEAEFMRLGYIEGDRSEELLTELPCAVGQIPWGSIQELPPKLALLDLAIIPRVPTAFNEGQSITSGLQYAAAGVPFLVSPSAEYRRLATLGAGRVCETIPEWENALDDLLAFGGDRTAEAKRARECVDKHFGMEATGRRYADLFEELIGGR